MKKIKRYTEDDVVLDFGEWRVPTKWDEVSTGQMQEIKALYKDDGKPSMEEIVAILSSKEVDDVYKLPTDFYNLIIQKLSFMDEPMDKTPADSIEIDGERYFINHLEKLKVKEYVSFESILKDDENNYAAMLAILCRKSTGMDGNGREHNEDFDAYFDNEILAGRIELFKGLPITRTMPLIAFFLALYLKSEEHLRASLKERCAVLSSLVESTSISLNDGTCKNMSSMRRWMITRKLRKLRKDIYRISCTL